MKSLRRLVLCSLLVLGGVAASSADELAGTQPDSAAPARGNLWINPGFLAYHFNRDAGFRGLNWGLGVQSNLSDEVSVLAGDFINSDYVRSKYAAVAWQPLSWSAARIGFLAGALNGYPAMRNGGWFVAALPWVTIRNERIGVNLTYVPNFPHGLHRTLAAQLILRIW